MALTTPNAPAGAGPAPVSPPPRRRRPLLDNRRRQVVAGLVIAGALVFLLLEGLNNATVYFKTADQAVADRASLGSRPFRIEGTVEPDVHQVGGVTTFSIVANGVRVQVVNSRQPPQLFKPGIPVVLEGHWQGQVYDSDQIMVKHTASYVEAHPDRLKSQLPAGSGVPTGSGSAGSAPPVPSGSTR
jgi:cytochrome c-type biogenesis protein CcmE